MTYILLVLQSMKYREKMRIDHILEEYEVPEVLDKYLVGGMCGYDKEGLPIRIEPFGKSQKEANSSQTLLFQGHPHAYT